MASASENRPSWVSRYQQGFSLGLGLIGLLAWLVPLIGFPVTILGMGLGIASRSSRHRPGKTLYAIGLNLIGFLLCIMALAIGMPLWPEPKVTL